ncbi:MAG: tetratricopeptide repeat-containing sensor histidine kinase [Cyclobacteriaceae bacterium]|nr:tetratricopeptide repeat-containing sensor histidine kinase [Cyclobacteriaceae bacterium]MCH8516881.1 tetratricopeptide repeat-containing sensor histidine kinase [Cyclobacteriaceae bacterium]
MIRILFLTIFLFLHTGASFAQSVELDSLSQLISSEEASLSDLERIAIYNRLAFLYRNNSISKSEYFLEKAADLAEEVNDISGLARAIGYKGMIAYRKAEYDFAIDYHQMGLKLAIEANDSTLMSYRYNDLANIYADINELKLANRYNQLSLEIKMQLNDDEGIATSWRNIGIINMRQGQLDTAKVYLNKSVELASAIGDYRVVGYCYIYLGEIATQEGLIDQAKEYLSEAVDIQRGIKNQYGLSEALISKGHAFLKNQEFEAAKYFFEEGLSVAQNTGINYEIQRAYLGLSELYQRKGDFSLSLSYYKNYDQIKGAILSEKNTQKIVYLESKFQNDLNLSRIDLLEQTQLLKERELQRQRTIRNILIIGTFILSVLLLVSFYFYTKKTRYGEELVKRRLLIEKKTEEVEYQRQRLEQQNKFKDRLFSIIAHDLRGPMASLKGALNILDPKFITSDDFLQLKEKLNTRFNNTDQTLQNILYWVRGQMDKQTTRAELVEVISEIENIRKLYDVEARGKGVNVVIQGDPQVRAFVDPNHLGVIIRNLISNAIKFSPENSLVKIRVLKINEEVIIKVEDEGVGMSEKQIANIFSEISQSNPGTLGESGTGLGLYLIKRLLNENFGSLHVQSKSGKGTIFSVHLPLG